MTVTGGAETTSRLHLAQFNIAVLRYPIGHPATAGFEALIDETNEHAEASEGFVWRHGIDARDLDTAEYDDPLVTVNASVWESPAHLRDFAYRGFHRGVFRRRDEWFVDSAAVMWWLPAGTVPTLDDCKRRLAFHERHGSTPYVFGMGERLPVFVVVRSGTALRAELDGNMVATADWTAETDTAIGRIGLHTDEPWVVDSVVDCLALDAVAAGCRRLSVPDHGVDSTIAPITSRATRPRPPRESNPTSADGADADAP